MILLKKRLQKVRKAIKLSKAQAMLVTSVHNVRYLSGFTGSECWLLITEKENIFFGDFRYRLQAQKELGSIFKMVLIEGNVFSLLKSVLNQRKIHSVNFEAKHITYEQYYNLKTALGEKIRLCASKDIIEQLRMIKSQEELNYIRKAVSITRKSLRQLKPWIKPGVSEFFLKNKLDEMLKTNGASGPAFDTIVASGPNAAMPHARTTMRKIGKNDPVIIDVGADYKGYKSDLTRTFFSGKITQYVRHYKLLATAQDRAIKLIRPQGEIQKIDQIAREVLNNAGLGQYFGHALGHGVGLEVHEKPYISGKSKQRFIAGMVFTVEPGVYIPDSGGIRIEDMVLVTRKGYEVL
ncbi:MAG: Xaa-Pro peptidase family protein [Candidatus Omnitrophica bacterium]|nr:Xaa-Pro peptidase family protein [Candidatus Omnitrophota bacterium]